MIIQKRCLNLVKIFIKYWIEMLLWGWMIAIQWIIIFITKKIKLNSMEYPALEEIYDLSTQDLRKLQQQLRNNPAGREDLLETILLEIQERKALQYFSQLCNADNPYAKKVAAFNEEFLRLAAETIAKNHNARSQGIGEYQPSQVPSQQQIKQPSNIKLIQYKEKQKQQRNFISVSSKNLNNERQNADFEDKSIQNETHSQFDALSTTTEASIKKGKDIQHGSSRLSGEVKLNIGAKKNGKSKMKELMKNVLASTKVEDEIFIKRNSHMPPHSNLTTSKKYHIPGEKHENLELNANKTTKTKKSIQQPLRSQKSLKQQGASKKNIKSASEENKKKQIQAKMSKQYKKGTVKLPKINQYKDLVQMVKQQEEQRRARANKSQNAQKLPVIENHNQQSSEEVIKEQIKVQQDFNSNRHTVRSSEVKIKQNMQQVIEQNLQINGVIKEELIEQSLTPQEIQKLNSQKHPQNDRISAKRDESQAQKITNKGINIQQKQKIIEEHSNSQKMGKERIQSNPLHDGKVKEEEQKKQEQQTRQQWNTAQIKLPEIAHIIKSSSIDHECRPISPISSLAPAQNKAHQLDEDYSKNLIQQIEREQQNQYHFFGANKQSEEEKDQIKQGRTIQIIQNSDNREMRQSQSEEVYNQNIQQQSSNSNGKQNISKKCYSEEYWAHIREQAELKIKRFKQEKEYEQKREKFNTEINTKHELSDQKQTQDEKQQNVGDSTSYTKLKQQQQAFERQILQKQEQLNKMKKQLMKKTNSKVTQAAPIPKIIRPKPQFDYFSVYPTFNHIFSVMYLKPVSQALNDIPNIMRDIKTLFAAHIEHFSTKTTFKPAIFLPFDHNGAFQLTDPKQLIAHAQETYIDLKVMIERVECFNQNLHGQFNNVNDDMFYRVVKTKEEVYDIITTSFMRRKGWKELPHGCSLRSSWNLFWSWSKPDIDLNKLLVWQKINHFPFNKNLSRKDLLYKNLDFFRKIYKVSMNFLPLTFNLPKQFSQLSSKFHQEEILNKNANYWIMKPIGKSRGRGIKIVSSLSELNYTDNIVVQKYIANPMLIDGYKFDMRIYVLVTSFHPLEAFVYREGFARLSTQRYSLDAHSIKNTFVHLTNFAINRNNVGSNTNFAGGSKISLKTLKDRVTKMGYSFSGIWSQVHDIIIKSLLGCSISVPSFPTAFELFGYDIMVDQECNCHLIQINASPSLERSYMIDEIVKQNLIDDILDIVDAPDFDKKQLLEVFTERINAITNKKKITLEDDLIGLARILKYKPIRKVGERPAKMGLFEVVAPCEASQELEKLIKAKSGANNPMNID